MQISGTCQKVNLDLIVGSHRIEFNFSLKMVALNVFLREKHFGIGLKIQK